MTDTPQPDPVEGGEEESAKSKGKKSSFPKRYIVAIMIFLGICVQYALRVNLSVAIGAMCNNHTIQQNGFTIQKVCGTGLLRSSFAIKQKSLLFERKSNVHYISKTPYLQNVFCKKRALKDPKNEVKIRRCNKPKRKILPITFFLNTDTLYSLCCAKPSASDQASNMLQ